MINAGEIMSNMEGITNNPEYIVDDRYGVISYMAGTVHNAENISDPC